MGEGGPPPRAASASSALESRGSSFRPCWSLGGALGGVGGCRWGVAEADSPVPGLAWSRALAAECALRGLHSLTELGSHLTVVPEVVAEPGVPANAALVVAATLEVQLVGGFQQRV